MNSFAFATLARYDSNGSLDSSFGNNGIAVGPAGFVPYRLALQSDGKIIVVGWNVDFLVARFNSDGTLDQTFGNGGQVATDFFQWTDEALCVAIQAEPRPYRVIWRWHFYAGLIVLPVLLTAAITGGIYVFREELERVMYPHLLLPLAAQTVQFGKPAKPPSS